MGKKKGGALNVLYLACTGLLLRQIKDFWRAALLMSTLLYPVTDHTSDSSGCFDLERRRDIFLRVETSIDELGLSPCAYPGIRTLCYCL